MCELKSHVISCSLSIRADVVIAENDVLCLIPGFVSFVGFSMSTF